MFGVLGRRDEPLRGQLTARVKANKRNRHAVQHPAIPMLLQPRVGTCPAQAALDPVDSPTSLCPADVAEATGALGPDQHEGRRRRRGSSDLSHVFMMARWRPRGIFATEGPVVARESIRHHTAGDGGNCLPALT